MMRALLLAIFALELACVTPRSMDQLTQAGAMAPRGNAACPERPTLLFDQGSFDGRWVRGRILIQAGRKEVWIHPYALPTSTFSIKESMKCGATRTVSYSNPTLVGVCPVPEDCAPLRLRAGHQFGKEVDFLAAAGDDGEDCVEFTVTLSLPDKDVAYANPTLRLRARRGGNVEVLSADSCRLAPSSNTGKGPSLDDRCRLVSSIATHDMRADPKVGK